MELFEERGNKPILLPVQEDLLARGRAAYTNARRVIWQAHCGSGKTVIASRQTELTLERHTDDPRFDMAVLHIVHRRRLVEQMQVTLGKFGIHSTAIMQGRPRWNAKVGCASRDTLLAMLDAGCDLPKARVIIWDEAHVAANRVQDWYLRYSPDSWWTGYTATPVRPDGLSMNPPYQALVCMSPPSELIRIGRLCPVKVYNPDAVGQRRKKGDKVKPVGDPVAHWKKYANGLPTVVFAATVNDSKAIIERYKEAGITAEHIDAFTPDDERDAVFARSESGETKIISNVGVLIEGVDLPWLTCCQILRGCNSLVLWIQATGRVMRFFAGKEHGIVLDHAGAAHEFGLPDGDFIWTLDDEATNTKRNKPKKDRKPINCPQCGFVFVGKPACPECGKVLPKQKRQTILDSVRPGDGVLTEFNESQNAHINRDMLERVFRKCYYIAKSKGRGMNTVAAMFAREAGMPPWKAGLSVRLPYGSEWQMPAKEWQL